MIGMWFCVRVQCLFAAILLSVAVPADPVSGAFLTPGSGTGKKSGSGSGMNNPAYFRELRNNFLGSNTYLNSLMRT
jgi:hypothetical protein